ncbi:MAG: hypothetical protein A2020_04675 [Lentisphaerae bacterium GWF2_45_14]|nr:MAG: hypothetical protein A2020_04675 [Lentisphaerae bacterium GWF2_45_14]
MVCKKKLMSLIFIFLTFPAFYSLSDSNGVSTVRLKKIQKIVDSYAESGRDIASPSVKKSIFKDISGFLKLDPDIKPDTRTLDDISKEVRSAVEKNFPDDVKGLRRKVEAEADAKFKMVNILDYVSVEYQRGTTYYTVSGVFYNYGGNSIRVGDRIIAIFDLLPESRAAFDKEYCQYEKDKYISKRLNDYQQRKMEFSTHSSRKIRGEIAKHNEDAGYVFIFGNWKKPREVAEIYIKSAEIAYAGKKMPKLKPESPANSDAAENADKTPEPSDKDVPDSPQNVVADATKSEKTMTAEELHYDNLRKKIDGKRMQIANSCAGIDADQGYKDNIVTWGMSKEDVVLVLSKDNEDISETTSKKEGEQNDQIIKITTSDDGPIRDVNLHFLNNLLYKATVNFKIVSSSTMGRLGVILNERYGFTDEQKEQRKKLQEKGEEFDDAEKAKSSKEEPSKDNKDNKVSDIPIEQSYHWTGKITTATLYIKLKPDRSGYVDFSLIKENPKVKEEAWELAMKEKKRKADEQRAKEMDFSKKKVSF